MSADASHPTGHGLPRTPARSATVSPIVQRPSVSTSTRVVTRPARDSSIAMATASGSCRRQPSSPTTAA